MSTDIKRLETYKEEVEQTLENIKEEGEEGEWYVIEGERVKDYNMTVDDSHNTINMGSIGWSQDAFSGEADVRDLWGAHDIFTTKLLVHESDLSEEALNAIKEAEEEDEEE